MRLTELVEEYERRKVVGARHDSRAPVAKVYACVLDELRSLDGSDAEHRLMTTAEAATVLAVCPKTVARWASSGVLEGAYKTSGESGEWRIPATSVYGMGRDQKGLEDPQPSRLWEPTE